MEFYFGNNAYKLDHNFIFESFDLNENDDNESNKQSENTQSSINKQTTSADEFKNDVKAILNDDTKINELLNKLGINSNNSENSINFTQIISNLENLEKIIVAFKI